MMKPAAYFVDDHRPGPIGARNLPPLVWVGYNPGLPSISAEGPDGERFMLRFDIAFPGTRLVDGGAQLFVWTRRGVLRFDRLRFGAIPEKILKRYPYVGEAKSEAELQTLVRVITG